jgi:hypothetical protein
VDTEFRTRGDPHRGWCLCGVELRSGQEFRLWLDGQAALPPFRLDESTLFVAFVAGAEIATIRARGWPMPARIFDLFQEMRVVTNTGQHSDPHSLEAACAHYGIAMIEHAAKKRMQEEAQSRTAWSPELQYDLVEYCFEDALAAARLFLCVLREWLDIHAGNEQEGLLHALRRGRFAGVMGEVELRGIPIQTTEWTILRKGRESVFESMVNDLVPELRSIYRDSRDGPVFNVDTFTRTMQALGLVNDWPRTRTGMLSTTAEVLRMMLSRSSALEYLAEVMTVRSRFALLQCEVGADGRTRAAFFPGTTATGRCAPKATRFIYAAPSMFRHLIQVRPGRVVIQLDYAAQESALAGGYAEDEELLAAYRDGDVHLECARRCNMVPPDATSAHPMRKVFKICDLAVVYRAGLPRIAAQLGMPVGEAHRFYDLHRRVFHRTHTFCECVIDTAEIEGVTVLQDFWRKTVPGPFRPATAANFPIQGSAAGILKHAVLGFHDAGLPLIGTIHDAAVFEVDAADAGDLITTATRIMVEAGEWFIPGLRLKVDVTSSVPLQHLSHLMIEPLADPQTLESYRRHLARASKATVGVLAA